MKLILSPMFVALSLAAGLATSAQAQVKGNIEAGEGKVAMCIGCHGIMDYKTNFPEVYHVPKIAGQYPDYLFAALKAYKDDTHATWGRGNPVMAGMAKQFSNAELKAIAYYIGSLPGEVRTVPQGRFR